MLKRITKVFLSGLITASILTALVAIAQSKITYNPQTPRLEKPRTTRGTTSRGCTQNLAGLVELVAPSTHVGLTISSRPTLLFKLTRKSPVPAKLVIAAIDAKKALVEQQISVDEPGIESITLPLGIELEPNKEYIWSVVLICNQKRPSENSVAQASILRITQPQALTKQLEKVTSTSERAQILAKNGIWYDVITLVQTNPELLQQLINQKEKIRKAKNEVDLEEKPNSVRDRL